MLVGAMMDMNHLAALLQQEPDVKDAPGAPPLTLRDPSQVSCIINCMLGGVRVLLVYYVSDTSLSVFHE